MANLIDDTYFVRDINVPVGSTEELKAPLNAAIVRYEPEYLKKLLGYTLWKGVQVEIDAAEYTLYSDLVNGAEFSFDFYGKTITTKWEGLVNAEKISPIAHYTYYKNRENVESFNTGLGQRRGKGENSVAASAIVPMVKVWSDLVREMHGEQDRCFKPKEYRDFFLNNTNYYHFDAEPSVFNFLLANLTEYPDWVFTPLWFNNAFGI
jgi:hypothetical protein